MEEGNREGKTDEGRMEEGRMEEGRLEEGNGKLEGKVAAGKEAEGKVEVGQMNTENPPLTDAQILKILDLPDRDPSDPLVRFDKFKIKLYRLGYPHHLFKLWSYKWYIRGFQQIFVALFSPSSFLGFLDSEVNQKFRLIPSALFGMFSIACIIFFPIVYVQHISSLDIWLASLIAFLFFFFSYTVFIWRGLFILWNYKPLTYRPSASVNPTTTPFGRFNFANVVQILCLVLEAVQLCALPLNAVDASNVDFNSLQEVVSATVIDFTKIQDKLRISSSSSSSFSPASVFDGLSDVQHYYGFASTIALVLAYGAIDTLKFIPQFTFLLVFLQESLLISTSRNLLRLLPCIPSSSSSTCATFSSISEHNTFAAVGIVCFILFLNLGLAGYMLRLCGVCVAGVDYSDLQDIFFRPRFLVANRLFILHLTMISALFPIYPWVKLIASLVTMICIFSLVTIELPCSLPMGDFIRSLGSGLTVVVCLACMMIQGEAPLWAGLVLCLPCLVLVIAMSFKNYSRSKSAHFKGSVPISPRSPPPFASSPLPS